MARASRRRSARAAARGTRAASSRDSQGSSGAVGGDELVAQRHLGVGQQDRQLGLGEARAPRRAGPPAPRRRAAPPARGRAPPRASRLRMTADMSVEEVRRVVMLERQRERLRAVRLDDAVAHGVAHQCEQRVAVGGRERPVVDRAVQEDLDVDLVVGAVHAARVVDRVGEEAPAVERVLHAPALGEPEVAALADDPAAQLVAVDAHAVVGCGRPPRRASRPSS